MIRERTHVRGGCSQLLTQSTADVDSVESRCCIMRNVRMPLDIGMQLNPYVVQLYLLYGILESGTRVWARGVTCSQHAIKVSSEDDVIGVVPKIVCKCSVEKLLSLSFLYAVPECAYTLQSVVFWIRSAISRPSRLFSTCVYTMCSLRAIAVPRLLWSTLQITLKPGMLSCSFSTSCRKTISSSDVRTKV